MPKVEITPVFESQPYIIFTSDRIGQLEEDHRAGRIGGANDGGEGSNTPEAGDLDPSPDDIHLGDGWDIDDLL